VPELIALVATGGISHWPATPGSGEINEKWDREFLAQWAAKGTKGTIDFCEPVPVFAVSCTVARM
jgi:hypothetical protein